MRKTTVDRVNDYVVWWNYHITNMDNAPLEKKIKFLTKAVQGSLELITLLTEEVRQVEYGRETQKIILPIGIRFDDPIRQKEST